MKTLKLAIRPISSIQAVTWVATVCLTLSAAIAAFSAPVFAQPGGPFPSRADFEAAQPDVEEGLLPRVDNGDGTWSYLPAPHLDPQLRVQGEMVLWRYDGQARFSYDPQPVSGPRHRVVGGAESIKTPYEQLTSMVRIDRWGHRWRAESANTEAWAATISAEDAASQEHEEGLAERPHEAPPQLGSVVPWQPHSWSHNNCDSDWAKEEHVWEGESRNRVSSPDAWESTAVRLLTDDGGICTGAILTQSWVLTAAHCVSDDSNNPLPAADLRICRVDTSGCIDVSDVHFPSSYHGGSGSGGGSDYADDWALLELSSTWQEAGMSEAEDMDLSRVSDSVLDNLEQVNNLGMPGHANGCTSYGGWSLFHNDESEPVAGTYKKYVRLKIDTGPGHSGGAVYYCPGGSSRDECESGDKAYVFAVHAGYNTVAKRAVGPKVAYFRDAALAIMFD